MDISAKQEKWRQERPLFEAEFIHSHLLPFFNFNENTGDYEIKSECVNNTDDEDRKVAYEVLNTGWVMWLRAKRDAKAQAVPDLGELQERIAGHQYYHDEHGHMIVDMDDVVKEISGFDSWKAQSVQEGFILVEKAKLMQIIGSVSIIEPITRGNPYMDSVKRELTAITDVVKTVIEAQEPAND